MIRTAPLVLTLALALALGACESRYDNPFDLSQPQTVSNATYKAADMLAGQALSTVTRETPIAIATLSDVNQVETSSALGRMIAEQLGTRFVQLGYNVSEIKLRSDINVQQSPASGDSAGEFVMSRDRSALAGHTNVKAVVSGTYAIAGDTVLVNTRMIDVNTSRVLAAYDYTLPMNDDVHRMTQGSGGSTGIFSTGWAQ